MQRNNFPRLCNELVSFDLPHGTGWVFFCLCVCVWEDGGGGGLTLSSLTRGSELNL